MTFQAMLTALIDYVESIDPGEDQKTESDRFVHFEKSIEVEDNSPDRTFSLVPQRGPVRASIGGCQRHVWFDLIVRYAWTGVATAIRMGNDMILLQDALHGATDEDGIQRILIEDAPIHVPSTAEGCIDSILTVFVEYDPT